MWKQDWFRLQLGLAVVLVDVQGYPVAEAALPR